MTTPLPLGRPSTTLPRLDSHCLADQFVDGLPFVVTFGGQGADWPSALHAIVEEGAGHARVAAWVEASDAMLAPVAGDLAAALPQPFAPARWLTGEFPTGFPTPAEARSAALSVPAILLTQLLAIEALAREGLDVRSTHPRQALGHSQGILAVAALAGEREGQPQAGTRMLAVARLIGAAATLVGRRRSLVTTAYGPSMLAISDAPVAKIRAILRDLTFPGSAPVVSVINGPRQCVVSGSPEAVAQLRAHLSQLSAQSQRARDEKRWGGKAFAPIMDALPSEVGFHHPDLADAVDLVTHWATVCGIDPDVAEQAARQICIEPVDWPRDLRAAMGTDTRWVLDVGPHDVAAKLSRRLLQGTGAHVIPAGTPAGRDQLFTPGVAPDADTDTSVDWARFAPRLIDRGDGVPVLDTAFTRLTGRSPILLAGMTPTTVDPQIVASAANAGHWAELAGGGQVTEAVFHANMARLGELLDEGRTAAFNALFLDPYLWKMQIGGQRLVHKARAAGSPLDGVVISAGIPDVADALDIIRGLVDAGISYVALKPGSESQINQVLAIAHEVGEALPDVTLIVQIEGGHAGGHHSWEDLSELLLATYPRLRSAPNVVVCVGGGIGTPERAAEFLLGTWSERFGVARMPVDGVLVGTAAMACLEATTSPAVKQRLVDTAGTVGSREGAWVGAGRARHGIASGRSQLGADIHEVDNAASRCGRLLDAVAGDAAAVSERRSEIIEALDKTAKPYFGDVGSMTYERMLRRYLEVTGADPWRDGSWRDRFGELLDRAVARVHPLDSGEIERLDADLDDPGAAVDMLIRRYPEAATCVLHPADVPWFVEVCRRPGKPVNFVPVIDADVRQWWRSDSLWQSHDPAYSADEVIIIPGPVAVAGITRVDEPVAELLGRFERAAVAAALQDASVEGADPVVRQSYSRRGTPGLVAELLAAPDVVWAGRVVRNPIRQIAPAGAWTVSHDRAAVTDPSGATVDLVALGSDSAELRLSLARGQIGIRFTAGAAATGGLPRVDASDAAESMRELLRLTAGGHLPPVVEGRCIDAATSSTTWHPDSAADHTAVTAPPFVRPGHPDGATPDGQGCSSATVPDALMRSAWPAMFAAIGSAGQGEATACVEGLLDLVHLEHIVQVTDLPTVATELSVEAGPTAVHDTPEGRVLEVPAVMRHRHTGATIVSFTERFLIRGRTGAATAPPAHDILGDVAPGTRTTLERLTFTAPTHLGAFASASGDHNPLHTEPVAARLSGFEGPIVHGMWLSAVAQRAVAGLGGARSPRTIRAWRARWVSPLAPGSSVSLHIDRVGVRDGATAVSVVCRVGSDIVMTADAIVEAPRTAYVFPGQGIQHQGMGLETRTRSAAARAVWDRADAHTRAALGFSVLAVIRDNPTDIVARGVTHRHPKGVLFLTQFTQVAMATLALAQVAELREAGVFVESAVSCGHSVGEYNALAAATGILPLESLVEIVFHRGMAMHRLVPRDAFGRSNYGLAAIRPNECGLTDRSVVDFVADTVSRSGEFIEIVNYNLAGAQYAVAGTVAGLAALEAAIVARQERTGGKRAFILIPGIDVPFHSSVLRDGVAGFRSTLEELLPARIDHTLLVDRYVPNLVPRLFSLDRDFVAEIADLVPSQPLRELLGEWSTRSQDPDAVARVLLVELLAWQFASPVRWIETQDLLFGELGVDTLVEVGVANAPTLANLAEQTLRLPHLAMARARVLNVGRNEAEVFARDEVLSSEDSAPSATEVATPDVSPVAVPEPAPRSAPDLMSATPAAASEPAADLPFTAADATRVLLALLTRVRPDQIGPTDTIEGLCEGVSSRRNQVLVDLGAELALGAIDGAADAEFGALAKTVEKSARSYAPFGPVLTEAVGESVRRFCGGLGAKPSAIADRVTSVWGLGPGWVSHVSAALACQTRDGASLRGGALADQSWSDIAAAVDAAVVRVGGDHGIAVSMPAVGDSIGVVDSAALGELRDALTGPHGILANGARRLLTDLGLKAPDALAGESDVAADGDATAYEELVHRELGPEWIRAVKPAFSAPRAVLFDDRWASVREDLARISAGDQRARERSFLGLPDSARAQARWWCDRAAHAGRDDIAEVYSRLLGTADSPLPWSSDVVVVTGASPRSIATSVVARLLGGGATVIATTSSLGPERLAHFRQLYRDHASVGAALWVVPANLASFADIDALAEWIGAPVVESMAGAQTTIREGLRPTMVFPFAAPRVHGSAEDAGPRAEIEARVLLWGVERLVTRLAAIRADHHLEDRLHVVLPGSPNRGRFGGDGGYGEAKAALDAFVQRWHAEPLWAQRVSLVHPLIGWVTGTGLMGHNDPLVEAVTAAGVRTWSTDEMADELLALCRNDVRRAAAHEPVSADLTGGLGAADLDLAELARSAAQSPPVPVADAATERAPLQALTHPAGWHLGQPTTTWPDISARPQDLVVIVGAAEVGPCGSSRTRHELEVEDRLSPAGVLELAWVTGLIVWEHGPVSGWHDAATGEQLSEGEVVARFGEIVESRCGIRKFADDGALVSGTAPLMASVFLESDTSFVVRTRDEALAFRAADPAHTRVSAGSDGEWIVTRLAGSEIRVPRRFSLSRFVGAQVPDGFDPSVWGLGSMVESADRLAAWNLVATVDAFISSGFEPAELLRWIHPTRMANTQGTGIGGMQSTRLMYVDALLGDSPPNDVLQEALPNVIAAHTVQSYLGSYGSMVHPVAACATAAVSVEEGFDKIRCGKADVVVTGGFDDLGIEGIVGFANMNATADTAGLLARGVAEDKVCRPNDRRRAGFVEGQGGGTIVLARGDIAAQLGLPVLGVVAYAGSFADGIHTSIPAPGLGALGVACGGTDSPLARGLAQVGLGADDVAVISKHDTSTKANDPNESELHERIATALGRSDGAPLYVVSQKSLTGHAKGGAAAFQLIGLCQLLADGVVPPNRSLDCVDEALAKHPHLVWLREPLDTGAGEDAAPLRAGLVTSLGFGHVSAVVAVAHPGAFVATLPPDDREAYLAAASARLVAGRQRLLDAMCGGAPLFARTDGRRFESQQAAAGDEIAMLLDGAARLAPEGRYPRAHVG